MLKLQILFCTVDGDACFKSPTSNRIKVFCVKFNTSPELRQSLRLSSSAVFRFSIHSVEIGPSNIIHLNVLLEFVSEKRRNIDEITPSDHSMLTGSNSPNKCFKLTDFGFTNSEMARNVRFLCYED